MKLCDPTLLQGQPLRQGSDNLPSLLSSCSAQDDALLIAGLVEALSKASVIGTRGSTVKRNRRDFQELADEHGQCFTRAHRMPHDSFMKLHAMLFDSLDSQSKGPNGGIDSRLKQNCLRDVRQE